MVCCAAWRLAQKGLIARWLRGVFLLALGMQMAHLPFPVIILLAALLGGCVQQYWPYWAETSSTHAAASAKRRAASVMDDIAAVAVLTGLRRWAANVLIWGRSVVLVWLPR